MSERLQQKRMEEAKRAWEKRVEDHPSFLKKE